MNIVSRKQGSMIRFLERLASTSLSGHLYFFIEELRQVGRLKRYLERQQRRTQKIASPSSSSLWFMILFSLQPEFQHLRRKVLLGLPRHPFHLVADLQNHSMRFNTTQLANVWLSHGDQHRFQSSCGIMPWASGKVFNSHGRLSRLVSISSQELGS